MVEGEVKNRLFCSHERGQTLGEGQARVGSVHILPQEQPPFERMLGILERQAITSKPCRNAIHQKFADTTKSMGSDDKDVRSFSAFNIPFGEDHHNETSSHRLKEETSFRFCLLRDPTFM